MLRHIALFATVLLLVTAADAVSCRDGKTADDITPQSNPDTWSPTSTTYANANGIWSEYPGTVLEITGSVEACLYWGGYDGTLTLAKDIDTYYELTSQHGCTRSTCASNQCMVNGVCRNSYEYHASNAGIAPANSWETNLEYVQIGNQGDGVSLEQSSGDVTITGSWFKLIHDDAVEDDFCEERSVTITDTLIDNAFMLFAWDVRSTAQPCSNRGLTFYIDGVIGNTFAFAHSYEENTKPGVFKDDGGGDNAALGSFTNSVFLVGPDTGDQKVFPDPDWITGACENVVYLWKGTTTGYNAMLGQANNGSDLAALSSCISVVVQDSGETADEFLNRDLDELDGQSWNDIRGMWINGHYGSQPGCGIGPELAIVMSVLLAIRRRCHPSNDLSENT